MRGRHLRRRTHRQEAELNITAFMNLMVVLVPFLLVMAVFSRLAILELNLPTGDTQAGKNDDKGLHLEVVVYADGLVVNSRPGEPLRSIPHARGEPDVAALNDLLRQVKSRFPERTDASILLAPEVSYDALVQVMDAVRMTEVVQNGRVIKAELFPEIAVGDAPERAKGRG